MSDQIQEAKKTNPDEPIQVVVNGRRVAVPPGSVVAAAIALAGIIQFRRSVSGQPRGPFCGMGVCMECGVTINGQAHSRSCLTLCAAGMEVRTDE
jgi:predicted molibdopterin-dependent oxidoreductase YjgC